MMNFFKGALLGLIVMALQGCVKMTLAWADLEAKGPVAAPDVFLEAVRPMTASNWEQALKPEIKARLQRQVYGLMPTTNTTHILSQRVVDRNAFGGTTHIEEYEILATAQFGDAPAQSATFMMVVATPVASSKGASSKVPVIFMNTFCPNHVTIGHSDVTRPVEKSFCDGDGLGMSLAAYVFGRYNATPPIAEINQRGYAVATVYPKSVVPDSGGAGLQALDKMAASMAGSDQRWGAIGAWAWVYSRMADVLEKEERFEADAFIAYGHSRYGKSALLAGAFDERFAGVMAHQSGTGGAALNKDKTGESVAAITKGYPHWFAPVYAQTAHTLEEMTVDQHHLVALVAPRALLLSNARRDVWSDPASTFRAAKAADAAWELYESDGLVQPDMRGFYPAADLSFFIRPGTHGTTEDDWPAFFQFLDAHWGPKVPQDDQQG